MRKPIAVAFALITVGVLAACTSQTGSNVDETVANTTMIRAMANMSNMTVGSLELSVETDSAVERTYNPEDNPVFMDESTSIVADGSVNLKVSDLWGAAPKASVNATASLDVLSQGSLNGGTPEIYTDFEMTDQTVNAYYDNEFAYIDLSAAPTLIDMITEDMSEPESFPTKMKLPAGPVSELGIPDMTSPENALASSQVDEMVADALPMLATMPNITATQSGSELKIVYQLTQADLPDVISAFYLEALRMSEVSIPSSLDSSMQAELDAMVADIVDMIELTTFRFEVRINTARNILTYFQADIDVTVTIEDYEDGYWDDEEMEWVDVEVPYVETVSVDTTTTIQILKFSEPVTVTLPTDLATYEEMGGSIQG